MSANTHQHIDDMIQQGHGETSIHGQLKEDGYTDDQIYTLFQDYYAARDDRKHLGSRILQKPVSWTLVSVAFLLIIGATLSLKPTVTGNVISLQGMSSFPIEIILAVFFVAIIGYLVVKKPYSY